MRKNEALRKNGKGNRVGKGCVAFAALGVLCACLLTGCGQGIASIELEEGYFPFITNRQMREKGYTRRIGIWTAKFPAVFRMLAARIICMYSPALSAIKRRMEREPFWMTG